MGLLFPAALMIVATTLPIWAQNKVPDLSLGDPAPRLEITMIKGEPVDIHNGKGKNVFVVEFWATWCPACRASIPHLTELQEKYGDEGLVVLGISIEEPDDVTAFLNEAGAKMDYAVAVDRSQKTAYSYMVPFDENSIPHAFVVDKYGNLVWHGHPADPTMEPLIISLLNEKIEDRTKARSSRNQEGSGKK